MCLSPAAHPPRASPSFLCIKCCHSPLDREQSIARYPLAFHQFIGTQFILLVGERLSHNTKTQLLLEPRPLSPKSTMFTNKPPCLFPGEMGYFIFYSRNHTLTLCNMFHIWDHLLFPSHRAVLRGKTNHLHVKLFAVNSTNIMRLKAIIH